MNKYIQTLLLFAAAASAIALNVSAHATDFNKFQPAQSKIQFIYKEMNVPIDGSFKKFHAQLNFNPDKPSQATAKITIALASVDAGSSEANNEVAGPLWFNTKAFPTAHFVATAIKPVQKNHFVVTGTMTIKGKSHTFNTPATFHLNGQHAVFEGTFVLKRADFNIGEGMWADFGTVANEVQIKFRLVATSTDNKKS